MKLRPLGMRGQLAAVSLLLMALAGLASGIYLEVSLRRDLEARVERELFRHAEGLKAALATAPDLLHGVQIAEAMAGAADYRFTLIDGDGRVVADSDVAKERLPDLDNHATRPEVARALAGERGASHRYSTSVRRDLLYAALPLDRAEAQVVRVAMPAATVEEVIGKLRFVLGVAGVIALGVVLFMSGLASHLVTRTLRTLVVQARALAEQKGRDRIHLAPTADELENLAGSMNKMASELEDTVQKLASERDRFQAVLEGIGGGVIALDEERRVTLANHTAREMFRLDGSPVGSPLVEVVRLPALLELLEEEIDPARTVELELPGRKPRRVTARASKTPLSDSIVLVFYDVTEVRRLESIRRDFIANVSHELRTPVSVIRASAEALISGGLDNPAHAERFAAAVFRNAERLSRLVSDLLDLSRIESGRSRASAVPVNVADIAERVVEDLGSMAEERGQSVTVDVDPTLFARADDVALEQVLTNLLDNAVKYTPEHGHVTVRAERSGGRVRIEVEDDGPGIPDEHKERVFERFYRLDSGRSREMGGTGLGLSIVKHLVLAMGGQVGVCDGAPRGARFFVELPVAVLDPSGANPVAPGVPESVA